MFGEFKLTRRGNWLAVRGRTLRSAEIGLRRAKKCPAVRGIKLAPLEIKLAGCGIKPCDARGRPLRCVGNRLAKRENRRKLKKMKFPPTFFRYEKNKIGGNLKNCDFLLQIAAIFALFCFILGCASIKGLVFG